MQMVRIKTKKGHNIMDYVTVLDLSQHICQCKINVWNIKTIEEYNL